MTFADHIIQFNSNLRFTAPLPSRISIMNPYRENENALPVSIEFYKKYYSDNKKRHIILGINPGRFGSGVTGVSFTDTKRLRQECGINYPGNETHEPSSVFVYEMINAYGGAEAFYKKFYINSVCPLGFTRKNEKGKEVNYNYYDEPALIKIMLPFILDSLKKQLSFGIYSDTGFCFGTGKNEAFLRKINDEHGFFKKIISLEHPRFIMQYKSASKQEYINKYLSALARI